MTKTTSHHDQARAARTSAFEALFAANHPSVLAYCARRANRADAWDAASEVFVVAWRRFEELPSGDDALPWLLGVAHKVLSNQRRSEQRRKRLTRRAEGSTGNGVAVPEAQLIRNEEEAEVIDALARLRPADREIIQLSLWEELAPVQIAEVLGISRAAVDQRLSRAKRRLARQMERSRRAFGGPGPDREGGAR
jgi:RNA polymerase sigma-70 factor, ECF subfamily